MEVIILSYQIIFRFFGLFVFFLHLFHIFELNMLIVKVFGYTFRGGNSIEMFLPPFWKGVYSKRKNLLSSSGKDSTLL